MRISLFFVCGYIIICFTQLAPTKWYVTRQIVCINMKWSLVRLDPLDPHSEKMEGIYKTDNIINDITFGTSLFVFFDLNTYFQF